MSMVELFPIFTALILCLDIEIAQQAKLKRIEAIATENNIDTENIEQYGKYKAKVDFTPDANRIGQGKLILVTATTPNKSGSGKTTTSVALAQGLNHIGKKAIVALREPSLGPCFGMKGGAVAEVTRKYCPWKTSTCTLQAISMRSHPPTIPLQRCSITITTTTKERQTD